MELMISRFDRPSSLIACWRFASPSCVKASVRPFSKSPMAAEKASDPTRMPRLTSDVSSAAPVRAQPLSSRGLIICDVFAAMAASE